MSNEPKVSVIIPVHNAQDTLQTAIDSVLSQNFEDIEVIVVDDGSTDLSWSVIQCYNNNIIALRQRNQGASVARNYGASFGRGKYLKFLDADDYLLPESIAAQYAHAKGVPENGISFGGVIEWQEDTGQIRCAALDDPQMDPSINIDHFIRGCPPTASYLHPTPAFTGLGGFNTKLALLDDFDLFFRYMLSGHQFLPARHPIYVYRQHSRGDRISRRSKRSDYLSILQMYTTLAELLRSATPYYSKERMMSGLARHIWVKAREALRNEHREIAEQMFALATKLSPRSIEGSFSYRILAKTVGPIYAEGVGTGTKRLLKLRQRTR